MTTTTGNQPSRATALGSANSVGSLLVGFVGILVALLALPVVLVFGLPIAGWAIGLGLVLFNRLVAALVERSVRDSSITVALGAMGFSMIFRALATALTLFFVGAEVGAAGDRSVGLDRPDLARVALVVFLVGFTLDMGIEAIRRAGAREREVADDAAANRQETPA